MTAALGAATAIGNGIWQIDLQFQGEPGVVAAYLLAGGGGEGPALVETGPSSTLPALRAGIRAAGFEPTDLSALLVTHIHLDHAGAAGPLLRACPDATVYVHPIGAPHLIDPAKLLASATRIYGDRMDELWGEVLPIPPERIIPLDDGAPVAVGGRVLTPVFTPGHASHHIAFWDAAAGVAFTGDGAGVRMPGTGYNCPPTPPPDLDPAAWTASVRRLRAMGARRLCLTHFGAFDDVETHLDALLPELDHLLDLGRRVLGAGGDQPALTAALHDRMIDRLGDASEESARRLELATPSYVAALGLWRYVTRGGSSGSSSRTR